MYMFIIIAIVVFNFSSNQAEYQNDINTRYRDNGAATPLNDRYPASQYGYQNQNTRPNHETRAPDGNNINIGNGQHRRNVIYVNENSDGFSSYIKTNMGEQPYNVNVMKTKIQNPHVSRGNYDAYPTQNTHNTKRVTTMDNIENGFQNSNSQYEYQKQNTRHDFKTENRNGNNIIKIGNGQGRNNVVIIDERPREKSDGFFSYTKTNMGAKPYNVDVMKTTIQNPHVSRGNHDSYPTKNSHNTRSVTSIGNGYQNSNVVVIYENEDELGNTVKVSSPNYKSWKQASYPQHNMNQLNTNSWLPPSGDQTTTYINNIGMGLNNHNAVFVNGHRII